MKKKELIILILGLIITLTASLMWIKTWDFADSVKAISMLLVVAVAMIVVGRSMIIFAEGEKDE